jgi:SpoVK/Ycf46/Vps4 family AAA+-type ATPase
MHAIENAAFLTVPAHLVEHLAGPMLIPTLVDARQKIGPNIPLIVIIEDADRCLIDRNTEGSSLSALSSILNVSDGLLVHALDIRIICTTNAEAADFDEAILRDMRMIADLYVGPLPPEKAAAIYERLTHEEIDVGEVHTLAECYRAAAEGGFYEEGVESEEGELDERFAEATS